LKKYICTIDNFEPHHRPNHWKTLYVTLWFGGVGVISYGMVGYGVVRYAMAWFHISVVLCYSLKI